LNIVAVAVAAVVATAATSFELQAVVMVANLMEKGLVLVYLTRF
jgi:hypothetical protein